MDTGEPVNRFYRQTQRQIKQNNHKEIGKVSDDLFRRPYLNYPPISKQSNR
ncbi:hypothetical protein NEIMUCOT_03888 [Neisseria mucosa ATCC 25996]|uniref:Uncharacterized protein n=1 Tax=Neisseria mucosa (strain ATCC 25996 / DSM 4631 / NCTC 10774 / M26) TaxID=546266 RepID=D2ZTF2_NEIM2|nr:hypothetical protein NEIMUCOT_03888 [Neisseria mucosa ATCC 25996]